MKARQVRGEQDVVTIVATEAITKHRMVTVDGKHTAAEPAVGVALHDTDSGDNIAVACGLIEMVESGGTCTATNGLKTDSSGRVVDQGGSGHIVAFCIDGSTTAGDKIRVMLVHGGNQA